MENERDLPWMYWLAGCFSVRRKTKEKLLDMYGTAENIYNMKKQVLNEPGFLTDREKEAFLQRGKVDPEREFEDFFRQGGSFTWIGAADYPQKLQPLSGAPFALFYYGKLPDPEKKAVAIVGARGCTSYGRAAAGSFAEAAALAGAEIISGMACGIDNTAQLAALRVGGTSTAVLGCGTDICYPASSAETYWQLRENGCVLSEYPPGVRPEAWHFPARNRIISGLSDAVLVVEAREKSGSLITADLALEQGRDVYALPGRVGDALSAGCNRLIRQGAGLAESPEEFVAELGLKSLQTVNKCKKNENSLAKEENLLYSCVDLKPKNLEEILAESPFSAEKTMELLLNLLVRGVIREISRGLYVRERL